MIRLRQLSKRFGKVEAVRGLDLEIPSGQLVGLLGPNGAGKSTTVKMLTGMLPPSAGSSPGIREAPTGTVTLEPSS